MVRQNSRIIQNIIVVTIISGCEKRLRSLKNHIEKTFQKVLNLVKPVINFCIYLDRQKRLARVITLRKSKRMPLNRMLAFRMSLPKRFQIQLEKKLIIFGDYCFSYYFFLLRVCTALDWDEYIQEHFLDEMPRPFNRRQMRNSKKALRTFFHLIWIDSTLVGFFLFFYFNLPVFLLCNKMLVIKYIFYIYIYLNKVLKFKWKPELPYYIPYAEYQQNPNKSVFTRPFIPKRKRTANLHRHLENPIRKRMFMRRIKMAAIAPFVLPIIFCCVLLYTLEAHIFFFYHPFFVCKYTYFLYRFFYKTKRTISNKEPDDVIEISPLPKRKKNKKKIFLINLRRGYWVQTPQGYNINRIIQLYRKPKTEASTEASTEPSTEA